MKCGLLVMAGGVHSRSNAVRRLVLAKAIVRRVALAFCVRPDEPEIFVLWGADRDRVERAEPKGRGASNRRQAQADQPPRR